MHLKRFYQAIFLLGTTVGALHALSLSPVSSAVLQILGTIAASAVALVASTSRGTPKAVKMRQHLPAVTALILAVLAGYWIGWGGTKLYRAAQYELSSKIALLSSDQKVDAYRLLAIGRALGVPRAVMEERISQLAAGNNLQIIGRARLNPQQVTRALKQLGQDAGNCVSKASNTYTEYLKEISRLRSEAEKLIGKFDENEWVDGYLSLTIKAALIPLPAGTPGFELLMTAANCTFDEQERRQYAALDLELRRSVLPIEDEINRILHSSPEVRGNTILKNPEMTNENFH